MNAEMQAEVSADEGTHKDVSERTVIIEMEAQI
jgi:hypothetical protein